MHIAYNGIVPFSRLSANVWAGLRVMQLTARCVGVAVLCGVRADELEGLVVGDLEVVCDASRGKEV